MDEKALFLSFWEKEAPATRKVLSRIPEAKSDYKHEPKSRTARELAWLIVLEELFLIDGLEKGAFDWVERPAPVTMQEVLAIYDAHHDDITKTDEGDAFGNVGSDGPVSLPGPGSDEGHRPAELLGHAVRSGAPPRPADDVLAADGIDRPADLRAERGRADVTRYRAFEEGNAHASRSGRKKIARPMAKSAVKIAYIHARSAASHPPMAVPLSRIVATPT